MGLGIDTHVHVFDPNRFPYPDGPGYRPLPHESGTADDLARVLEDGGITHAVVVQPSGYGTDNAAVLDAIARSGGRHRGVAVVDPGLSDEAMDRLAAGGIAGVRVDLTGLIPDETVSPEVRAFFRQLARRGWLLQVQCPPSDLAARIPVLRDTGLPVVIDHLACADAELGLDQPGLAEVLAFGRTGQAVIKLSAPFRFSREAYPHGDVDWLVRALLDAFTPDRAVWASDWPFIKLQARPAYADVLALVDRWLPDPADRHRVLWQTPAALFGLSPAPTG